MNEPTPMPFAPLTRRLRIVSSRTVRERDERSPSCTEMRTEQRRIRAREKKALDGGKLNSDTPLVAVEWEDITAYSRTAIPDDFEPYRLRKLTCGMLWKDTTEYVVIVGDYDMTNEGKDYRHNDFHIIPRGVIRKLTYLTDADSLVSLQIESESA
jgi:hypothetical protein